MTCIFSDFLVDTFHPNQDLEIYIGNKNVLKKTFGDMGIDKPMFIEKIEIFKGEKDGKQFISVVFSE